MWTNKRFFCAVLAACLPFAALFGSDLQCLAARLHTVTTDDRGVELHANDLYAQSAVLMDADNGRILFEKNGYETKANASTTKIMTLILALENGSLDSKVTVSSYAAKMPDVQLNIREGEQYYLKDLLYSMMLESHNDSAVAIAEHVGGSVENFSVMMNQKAREIGCYDTNFITPNGLDSSNENGFHGTSAENLARILRYCIMDSPCRETFLEITRTGSYSFTDVSGKRSFSCVNRNALLNMVSGAITGKTGFTGDAGYCYVGAFEVNGHRYTAALLACGWPYNKNYKWADMKKLIAYATDNFEERSIDESIISLPDLYLENGEQLDIRCQYSSLLMLAKDEQVTCDVKLSSNLALPVAEGSVVGDVRIYINDELYDIAPVYTAQSYENPSFRQYIRQILLEYLQL